MANKDWGPSYWYLIHRVAYNAYRDYPDPNAPEPAAINNYVAFFANLAKLLPCAECRGHFSRQIGAGNRALIAACSSRASLISFFDTFHNQVNERLRKRTQITDEAKVAKYTGEINADEMSALHRYMRNYLKTAYKNGDTLGAYRAFLQTYLGLV